MAKWNAGSASFVGAVIYSAVSLTACGNGAVSEVSVRGGAVPLTAIHVGTPESVFQQAIGTFGQDPNGSMDGKTQYLSRMPDAAGGQFVIQAKNSKCFEINVLHQSQPVSKEVALKTLHQLLPVDAPAQSKIDDSQLSNPAQLSEVYYFGDQYSGQLTYADKTGSQVKIISAKCTPTM